jgi:hypothetical protein
VANPEVQQAFDKSVWDRSHGTADAVVTRAAGGAVTNVGGVTFDQADRADAKQTAGTIIDTTAQAVMLASGVGAAADAADELVVAEEQGLNAVEGNATSASEGELTEEGHPCFPEYFGTLLKRPWALILGYDASSIFPFSGYRDGVPAVHVRNLRGVAHARRAEGEDRRRTDGISQQGKGLLRVANGHLVASRPLCLSVCPDRNCYRDRPEQ